MLNLDDISITPEALRRLENTPDARLHEIMASLTTHLHNFARDVKLTEEEWFEAMMFLTRTGQTCTPLRQEFILLSDTLGLSQLVVAQNHRRHRRASEQTVLGPFHVEDAPSLPAHGADLAKGVSGEPLFVSARVADEKGPVTDAAIEVWHADTDGFYDVQDADWTPQDARLRGIFRSDGEGRISFWSIMPKSYPIPTDGPVGEMLRATRRSPMRPAHIHFKIVTEGFDPLVTHVFKAGDEYLDSDAVFGVRSSCVGEFLSHAPGRAPDGRVMTTNYRTMDCTFTLDASKRS